MIDTVARKNLLKKAMPLLESSDENAFDRWDEFDKYLDGESSQDEAIYGIGFEFWSAFDPDYYPENRKNLYKKFLRRIMLFLLSEADYLPLPKRRRIPHPEKYDFWPFRSEQDYDSAKARDGDMIEDLLDRLDYPEEQPPPRKYPLSLRILFSLEDKIICFFQDVYDFFFGAPEE